MYVNAHILAKNRPSFSQAREKGVSNLADIVIKQEFPESFVGHTLRLED